MSKKVPPTKPVNDLIKFWAAQQDEKEKATSESVPRSPRRPLSPSPNTDSTPPSPKQPLSPTRQWNSRDTPTTSPPLSPTINNIKNKSITDASKSIRTNGDNNDFQKSMNETFTSSLKVVESSSSSSSATLRPIPDSSNINDSDTLRLRDPIIRAKAASQMVQRDSLPPVKNVSDLVSKFEKVTSPPTSPTTLTPPTKKFSESSQPTSPTSPKPMSPIKRNQTIEPLSISQPLSNAISDTLISQIKNRDTTKPPELSIIPTSINESSTALYSPIKTPKTPTSMKRRSNIPDPIIIPSPTTSTKSIKETRLFNDEPKITKDPTSPKKGKVIEDSRNLKKDEVNKLENSKKANFEEKSEKPKLAKVFEEQEKLEIQKKAKEESEKPEKSGKLTSSISSSIKSIVSPTTESKSRLSSKPKSDIQKSKTESNSKSKIKSPKLEPTSPELPKRRERRERRDTKDLPEIRPTSEFNIDFLEPIFNQPFELGEGQIKPDSFINKPTSSSSKQQPVVPTKEPIPELKSPISPKDDSRKRSTTSSSNLPIPNTESLPRVSLSSPSGQEITAEILSNYTSSPPARSPISGSTPVGSMPTSPEFASSNLALELLPEITPISPFWNPAAATGTGSNTVSPLWKPSPGNQRLISPILAPEPDNSLSQKIASALNNEISIGNNLTINADGSKSPLWFKRSSSSFLKVPNQSVPSSPTQLTMQEAADPTAHSYIFSFLSDDINSLKFFTKSPNASSTHLKLDLNPFSSYLDNVREDNDANDATDVENEDQNYNPFLDKEQSDLEGEEIKKHMSKDEIVNSHAIEMQVTNITHSRSTTKVDDENDPMAIHQTDKHSKNVNGGYNGLKKSRSIQSLDSVTKFKQRRHRSQNKYKPVQIPNSPYSKTRPQRHTLSPTFILKDKQNLLSNITVTDFTTITKNEKDDIQENNTLDISVANMTESVDPISPKFTINPFDEFEKNELFLPGTPWVHLPHLDEYIQTFPKTQFSNPKEVMTSEEYEKFLTQGNFHKNPENLFPLISQSTDDDTNKRASTSKVNGKDEDNIDGPSERGINGPSDRGITGHSHSSSQETVSILYEQRFLKLEIIRDFIQFTAIGLSFATQGMFNDGIYIILSSIPNFLSLNLDRVFGSGVIFFLIFCIVGFASLFMFRRITSWKKVADIENLESPSRTSLLQNHIIIFVLTTLYAPLTKLSFDALFWSDTFWPIKNPYLPNVDFPDFNSMIEGGNDALRFPKDFCYVTSMKKNELNFSPFIISLGILNLCVFTFWFPIKLKRIVNTHMGKIEGKDGVDNYPHKFLYNGYSENWGTYKSYIMGMKSFLIFFMVLVSKDNCLFRSTVRQRVSIAAHVLKIILFVLLFLPHWKSAPFIYLNFNTAEYWARFAYLITGIFGFFVILQVGLIQGFGIGLFIINVATLIIIIWYLRKEVNDFSMRYTRGGSAYGLSRSVSGSGARNLGNKKLEFSFDISSPSLNFDRLIKERIWQDTWSKLLLINDKFRPPAGKTFQFSEANYHTPYLLNFSGSVGERHIENSKILSVIGIQNYIQYLTLLPSSLRSKILNNYVGVDMYYNEELSDSSKKTCFGKAFVVPFPFSIIMHYDEDDSIVVLTQDWEIQKYLQQNEDEEIQRSRLTRQMIRALEGKNVIGPCCDIENHCHRGILSIQRKQGSLWREHDLNPGFKVTITYSDSGNCPKVVGHDIIGITDDFKMTHQLERLFGDNLELIEVGLDQVKKTMDEYRRYYRNEWRSKEDTLTYGFHINVFNNPSIPLEILPSLLITTEENQLVRSIPEREYPTIVYLYERMRTVHTSRVHQWWYLFWEDLWKSNEQQIPHLRKYEQDFSPLYRTSICYQPMKRLELEEFMEKRGLWLNDGKFGLFHSGVLNRIYLYLNGAVFSRKGKNGSPKKWRISENNSIGGKGEKKSIIGKVGVMKNVVTGINRNSRNSKGPYYIMREENSDSDFEDVELDANNNNVSDDETLYYK